MNPVSRVTQKLAMRAGGTENSATPLLFPERVFVDAVKAGDQPNHYFSRVGVQLVHHEGPLRLRIRLDRLLNGVGEVLAVSRGVAKHIGDRPFESRLGSFISIASRAAYEACHRFR